MRLAEPLLLDGRERPTLRLRNRNDRIEA